MLIWDISLQVRQFVVEKQGVHLLLHPPEISYLYVITGYRIPQFTAIRRILVRNLVSNKPGLALWGAFALHPCFQKFYLLCGEPQAQFAATPNNIVCAARVFVSHQPDNFTGAQCSAKALA